MLKTEEYPVETADRCILLARQGRQLLERLEAISNELMAKVVEDRHHARKESKWRARASAQLLVDSLVGIKRPRC